MNIIPDILPSRCYDAKSTLKASAIVLHATASSTYDSARSAYLERGLSVHFTVDKQGRIYQNVPEEHPAYHAGASQWKDEEWANRFAFGIEMVNRNVAMDEGNTSDFDEYPMPQVSAVLDLVLYLAKRHRIPWKRILTHALVSPGRKYDPAGFYQYFDILEAAMKQEGIQGGYADEMILVPDPANPGKWKDVQGEIFETNRLKVNASFKGKTYINYK